jgi:hypothetical protein
MVNTAYSLITRPRKKNIQNQKLNGSKDSIGNVHHNISKNKVKSFKSLMESTRVMLLWEAAITAMHLLHSQVLQKLLLPSKILLMKIKDLESQANLLQRKSTKLDAMQ